MTEILRLIHQITANGESGRLEILAGAIQGELSFADGKLVDARLGYLTGFRAINAIAAMQDVRFGFDPSFAPLGSSSITASERVVLKQFFGIETAATSEYFEPVATVPEDVDEAVTIVRSNVPTSAISTPPAARFSYRTALALAVVAVAVLAAAAIFIDRWHEPAPSKAAATVESPSRPAPDQPQPEKPAVAQSTSVRDLSGKWKIVNSVETTSYRSFRDMKFGFDLSIDQKGSTFTGKGMKVSENGRSLPASSQTPIQVKGSINGDSIEATFIEEGAERKSNGRFVWRIDKAGRGLNGSFATTAARSSGKSAAVRL